MEPIDSNINPKEWLSKYGDQMFNYAKSRLSSFETAEDMVQETFISALKGFANFRGESSEKTWLFSILKRKIIDYYRKSSTKNEINESKFELPFENEGFFEGHWIKDRAPADWTFTADGNLHQAEFQQVMEYCLSILPERWKSIFIMKMMEDVDTDEICKDMNCSSSNLWVILHRARLKLRECIEKNWIDENN
ncbi:MAG: hypothetical protein AUJ98_08325 [Bacteroidetes bacterium CG2_30_33_31]|nr:MAG: hypothetical protein AUJ98_08325 [Bacteroidetes bacterium CG2_30_33_31]